MNTQPTIFRAASAFAALSLLPLALPAAGLEDWTLEQVLLKVEEANGGMEEMEGVTNVRIRGELEAEEATFDFLLLKKRPDKVRLRLMYLGRSVETVYDGKEGWRRSIINDEEKIEPLSESELRTMRAEADFDGPLVGPVAEGFTRRLVGVERIDRSDYFVVEVDRGFEVNQHYVDSRTFREMKVVTRTPREDGGLDESITWYHDFKKFGTIWVAMRTVRDLANGQRETVIIHDVEVNPGLLDLVFAKPRG